MAPENSATEHVPTAAPADTPANRATLKTAQARLDMLPPRPEELHYSPALFCQLCLPTHEPLDPLTGQPKHYYQTESGRFKLEIRSSPRFGVPFGTIPRGISFFAAGEYLRQLKIGKCNPLIIRCADNFTDFMLRVSGNTSSSGGAEGNYTRWKRQLRAMANSTIGYQMPHPDTPNDEDTFIEGQFLIIDKHEQRRLFEADPAGGKKRRERTEAILHLDPRFADSLSEHAVPLNPAALRALWGSCLRMDIYTWLTYRANVVQRLDLSWEALKAQFGAGYDNLNISGFKRNFREAFAIVRQVYDISDPDCIQLQETWSRKHRTRLCITVKHPSVPPRSDAALWPRPQQLRRVDDPGPNQHRERMISTYGAERWAQMEAEMQALSEEQPKLF